MVQRSSFADRTFRAAPVIPIPPPWFSGSWPEYLCYRELLRQGLRDGPDFTFQASQLGGRLHLGGMVIDFEFTNPPGLAINVNGVYYHYQRGGDQKGRDIFAREQMASAGFQLIFIDDDDLERDPKYYVSEALNYRDHSELSK